MSGWLRGRARARKDGRRVASEAMPEARPARARAAARAALGRPARDRGRAGRARRAARGAARRRRRRRGPRRARARAAEAVAAPGAQRDRRRGPHEPRARAAGAERARAAVAAAAEGYANLELDLATGERGSRHAHVEALLRALTGAEAALVVNNCAAAMLLAVAALAGPGREVVVSRGQLVEIGGGFRIPDVVAQAGAELVEVGTTNRTRLGDYAAALGERHRRDPAGPPVELPHRGFRRGGRDRGAVRARACRSIDDVGSGVLADELALLAGEPAVRRSVRAGAARRLLLRRQAARRSAGRRSWSARATRSRACRRHPLARALRIDKLSLAGAGGDAGAVPRPRPRAAPSSRCCAMLEADARRC